MLFNFKKNHKAKNKENIWGQNQKRVLQQDIQDKNLY